MLKKCPNFRTAFDKLDPSKVARSRQKWELPYPRAGGGTGTTTTEGCLRIENSNPKGVFASDSQRHTRGGLAYYLGARRPGTH
jgi:hypothetical protein